MKKLDFDIYEILRLHAKFNKTRKVTIATIISGILYKMPYLENEISINEVKMILIEIIPISINKKKNRKHFIISKKHLFNFYNKNKMFLRPFNDVKREYYGL